MNMETLIKWTLCVYRRSKDDLQSNDYYIANLVILLRVEIKQFIHSYPVRQERGRRACWLVDGRVPVLSPRDSVRWRPDLGTEAAPGWSQSPLTSWPGTRSEDRGQEARRSRSPEVGGAPLRSRRWRRWWGSTGDRCQVLGCNFLSKLNWIAI